MANTETMPWYPEEGRSTRTVNTTSRTKVGQAPEAIASFAKQSAAISVPGEGAKNRGNRCGQGIVQRAYLYKRWREETALLLRAIQNRLPPRKMLSHESTTGVPSNCSNGPGSSGQS